MKNKELSGIYVSPGASVVTPRKIIDNLKNFYELLECDLIDISLRKINGEYFDFVCDDEGLFKTPCLPSACDPDGQVALVGNLFICRHDNDGELIDLTEEDIKVILSRVRQYSLDGSIRSCVVLDSLY